MSDHHISCHDHDYFEIACMYGYQVKLELTSGECLQGRALTTETTKNRKEYLVLDHHGETEKVELLEIRSMQAINPNPHFSRLCLSR